jgi:hypothetical protein
MTLDLIFFQTLPFISNGPFKFLNSPSLNFTNHLFYMVAASAYETSRRVIASVRSPIVAEVVIEGKRWREVHLF